MGRSKFEGGYEMVHIATLSGGKDSTTMVDMLLRHGRPLDHIVFKDTLHEFELMYRYVERLSEYFKTRYGKEVIMLKPEASFENSVFGKISKGENEGLIRGLPAPQAMGFCTWRREAKTRPFERWLKEQGITEYKIYIGFTTSEIHRKMAGDEFLYPLIDDFSMSETDCAAYLREREMENPLYRYFTRTGCSFCPAQSDRSFFQVWKHFPKDWEYMKQIEAKLFQLEKQGERVQNKYWFSRQRTCADMEKEFIKADKQSGLFDFSDEPLKDCFCKI